MISQTDLVLAIITYLGFSAMGVSIWFGFWRSWMKLRNMYREGALALPWGALFFTSLVVLGLVRLALGGLGFAIPSELVIGPSIVFFVIGVSAASFQWPKWALPPWYREYERQQEDREARENKGSNGSGR